MANRETLENAEELIRCAESFDYFCDHFVQIQDKASGKPIPFDRFGCQRRISDLLVARKWLVCLKARQLGITWLAAAYCLWRMLFRRMFTACVVAQNRLYAKDFLIRVKFIYARLPAWMRIPVATDSVYQFSLNHGEGEDSELRVLAGGDKAGRSLTGDLIILDEHAFVPEAKVTREGCEPSVECSHGQIVAISTSNGPFGDFYELFMGAPENRYEPVFLKWSERPGRDQAWYAALVEQHQDNPLFVPREYPSTPAEAFLYAEGRCFPAFDPESHVRLWEDLPYHKGQADLYRAIDFGNVAAFVCIWLAHWPDARPGFSIDPECTNSIRELLGYHFQPLDTTTGRDRPAKVGDHVPDALRYAVMQYAMEGHVHLYRELYVEDSAAAHRTDLTDLAEIHEMSGWIEARPDERVRYKPGPRGERFEGTVADPSMKKTIELYCANDLICEGYIRRKEHNARDDVMNGINAVNLLMDGSGFIRKSPAFTAEQLRERQVERTLGRPRGPLPTAGSLQDAALRQISRENVARRHRQRQRSGAAMMSRYRPY
jgi:hypothetical protein